MDRVEGSQPGLTCPCHLSPSLMLQLEETPPESWLSIFLGSFNDTTLIVLIVSAVVSLVIGMYEVRSRQQLSTEGGHGAGTLTIQGLRLALRLASFRTRGRAGWRAPRSCLRCWRWRR